MASFSLEDQIKYYTKKLTMSGKNQLDEAHFKKLKNICKKGDSNVIQLADFLMKQFKKKHAEVRFNCLLIINQLFRRSHCFRCYTLNVILVVIKLVFGDDITKDILRPIDVANTLKTSFIKFIKEWDQEFGKYYNALPSTIKYLMKYKSVNFEYLDTLTPRERLKIAEEERKLQEKKLKSVKMVESRLDQIKPEILENVKSYENCLALLIPNLDNFFIPTDDELKIFEDNTEISEVDETDDSYGSDFARTFGITKGVSIQIDLNQVNKIQATKDNESVIVNMRENIELNKKWLDRLKSLEQMILPHSAEHPGILQMLIALKSKLEYCIGSHQSLDFVPETSRIDRKCKKGKMLCKPIKINSGKYHKLK